MNEKKLIEVFDVLKNTLQSIAESNPKSSLELLENNSRAVGDLLKVAGDNKKIVRLADEMITYNRMLKRNIESLPNLVERLEKEMAEFFSAIKEE